MDVLFARWQMAVSLGFHIIFASVGIAMPVAALVPVLLIGSAILLPSLWWLMRVFKSQSRGPEA